MRSSIPGITALIVLSVWAQTNSQPVSPLTSAPEGTYASVIRVEPDTLSFVWSQIEGYRALAADGIAEYVTSSGLLSAIDRTERNRETLDQQPLVVEFAKQGVDTLQPPWEGPFFVGWSAPFRVEYEATQLTPSQPAEVIGLIHGVASSAPNLSKECSVFVWDGRGTRPGSKLYGGLVTASVQDPLTVYLNYYSTPSIIVDGPFWVGNFEMDTLFPTSALDSTITYLNAYAEPDSDLSWSQDQVEYFHGAIVSYDAISDTLKTMIVYNDGDSTLEVSNIVPDQSWIASISPISFSVPPGGSQSVAVEVTSSGLGTGTYEAVVTIHNDDPSDSTYEEPVRFVVNTVDVVEEGRPTAISSISLQVDPNPAKDGAVIVYEVSEEAHVEIGLFDRSGRSVIDFVDERLNEGTRILYWNGQDRTGNDLPAGVYFCTLSARPVSGGAQVRQTIKLVVLD